MAILVVAAEAAELKPFAGRLSNLKRVKWPLDYSYEGILNGHRVLLAANGAGPQLALRAVEVAIRAFPVTGLSSSRLEAVVSAGFCGALLPNLRESDIVIGTSIIQVGDAATFSCEMPICARLSAAQGPVISQNRVAVLASDKAALSQFAAVAVDMESAGVAARTLRAGLPFYCVKVVSDRLEESFGFDLNSMRTSDGRIGRGKIVMHTLAHPRLVPELLRLKRRSDCAAEALGEFLVSCQISPERASSEAV